MKMVFRLMATILVLFVLAPVASARVRRHSQPPPAQQDFPEMTITDEWSPDLIVSPPIPRPSGSNYDTPKPHAVSFAQPAPAPPQNGVSIPPASTDSGVKLADGVFPMRNAVPT